MSYNEFYEHKKSDAVKWAVVFILIAILTVGTAASLIFSLGKKDKTESPSDEPSVEARLQDELQIVSRTNSPGIKLSAARASSETEYNTVLLTATVMPEDVENKAVDWSIEWQMLDSEFATGKTVTDYCTVTPTADGALTAKVRCLQPFEEYIDVKVTTREGGYVATCTVTFAGKPSELTVTSSEVTQSGGSYNLGVTNPVRNYTFDLNLSNEWNQVGDKFYDFTFTMKGYGDFQVQDMQKDTYNSEFYPVGDVRTLQANDWLDSFIDVEITDGKLIICPKRTPKTFGSEQVIMGGGRKVTNAYKSGGENVYFDITVTTATGLSQTIKIKPVSAVNGVSVDKPTIEF